MLLLFILDRELDARVDFVEAAQEVVNHFHSMWRLGAEFGDKVVDVFLQERRSLAAFLTRDFEGFVDGE